ncbi:hypothetical protein HD553DRAFT_335712 [Filobasidium floriforme]|uniref:uncharacterized protein n=1 Tax=Filobasidium floriforme TaxID=5210 RepID=UPI001E8DD256|nr:uncharacterized protein HD553DRAFT_335712 [Filobasidium floriforme]KAH8083602.1 hypothetical protein HD553DRAFT_335712 [Filobasidium floriforme]
MRSGAEIGILPGQETAPGPSRNEESGGSKVLRSDGSEGSEDQAAHASGQTTEDDPVYRWTFEFQVPHANEKSDDIREMSVVTDAYPLLKQRWPTIALASQPQQSSEQLSVMAEPQTGEVLTMPTGEPMMPPLQPRAIRTTPTKANHMLNYRANSLTADEIGARYREICPAKFDPRFLTLQADHTPQAEARIEKAVAQLQALLWTLDTSLGTTSNRKKLGEHQHTYSRLEPNFRRLTDILWGSHGGSQFHYTGHRKLKRNPDLQFEDGHGGDWSRDGNDCCPDLVTTLPTAVMTSLQVFRAQAGDALSWKPVSTPIEVRTVDAMDMRSGSLREQDNQVPRLLKYMDLTVRNHPAINRVFGLTISGIYLRLWTADAASFSSSRLYRLDNPKHARQIVEIIAFITQPHSPHFQAWTPTSPLTIRAQIPGSSYQEFQTSQLRISPSFKMLEVRPWLFGSRTIVWATTPISGLEGSIDEDSAHRQEVCKPNSSKQVDAQPNRDGESSSRVPEREGEGTLTRDKKGKRKATEADLSSDTDEELDRPAASRNRRGGPLPVSHPAQVREGDRVVLKATWQYKELKRHEERVLRRLHGDERPGREDLGGLHVEDHIDSNVLRHLPRALGLVDEDRFADWITHENTLHSLSPDPDHAEKTRLHFSVLAVACPLGQRLPAAAKDSSIGLRQYAQILLGGIQSDWFSASKGIHYRDNNPGNLMWKQLATVSDGRSVPDVVGFLVDFGNARILEQARLTFDWMRNTALALSLCADDGRSANPLFQSISSMKAEKIRRDCEEAIAERSRAGTTDNDDVEAREQSAWASDLADWETQALQLKHRYLDDVESLLYLVSYDIWAVHIPNNGQSHTRLDQLAYKQAAWAKQLLPLCRGIVSREWTVMIKDLVVLIDQARFNLRQQQMLPSHMHPIENQCFYDLCERVKQSIPQLPDGVN